MTHKSQHPVLINPANRPNKCTYPLSALTIASSVCISSWLLLAASLADTLCLRLHVLSSRHSCPDSESKHVDTSESPTDVLRHSLPGTDEPPSSSSAAPPTDPVGNSTPLRRPPPQGAVYMICCKCGTIGFITYHAPESPPDDISMIAVAGSINDEINYATAELVAIRQHIGMTSLKDARDADEQRLQRVLKNLKLRGFEDNPLWWARQNNLNRRIKTSGTWPELFNYVNVALQLYH
jgi:hypothetical protein